MDFIRINYNTFSSTILPVKNAKNLSTNNSINIIIKWFNESKVKEFFSFFIS